ncbi:branched-chain amino acid ABC transporter permease [Castellaniella sp. GW247-6E4]|uniref:branched-chain amino acid ABC transporter permease n=1 Tax=Castellaniella sp. GW247-6E4 TaxID=3140380 RepID=UPI003315D7AE
MTRAHVLTALAGLALVLLLPHFAGAFAQALTVELLIYSMFALSIGVLYGHTGMMSFGHAGFFGVGAYAVALTITKLDAGLATALLAAVGSTAILAIVVAAVAVRLKGHYFALITLIVGLILYYLGTGWRSLTNAEDGISFARPELFSVYALGDPKVSYYFLSILAILAIFFIWFLLTSPLGRLFRGLRENDDRARYLGYPVARLKMLSFTISGTLAGLSGGMYALFSGYVNSEFLSWILSGEAVMWAMVGGAGSLIGPILGASLLIWGREVLSSYLIDIYPILVGSIMILSVIFLRGGLAGAFQQIRDAWEAGRAPASSDVTTNREQT